MIRRGEAGQGSVELVAMLPLVVVAALAAGQLVAAGLAREFADHGAQAAAMALVQETGSPAGAAREALPGWSRRRVEVAVHGRRVDVTVRPPSLLPGIAGLLVARRSAHAGAAAATASRRPATRAERGGDGEASGPEGFDARFPVRGPGLGGEAAP